MNTRPQPFEQFYDLRRLSEAGTEIKITADESALERLAQWLDAERVTSFKAMVSLKRTSPNRFDYKATFECDLVQKSVVSLEPVAARVEERFTRELHLMDRHRSREPEGLMPLAPGDEGVPEEIDSPSYDLAAPILEELSLALDPYPRAPGEEFTEIGTPLPAKVSPFAILKKLKEGG